MYSFFGVCKTKTLPQKGYMKRQKLCLNRGVKSKKLYFKMDVWRQNFVPKLLVQSYFLTFSTSMNYLFHAADQWKDPFLVFSGSARAETKLDSFLPRTLGLLLSLVTTEKGQEKYGIFLKKGFRSQMQAGIQCRKKTFFYLSCGKVKLWYGKELSSVMCQCITFILFISIRSRLSSNARLDRKCLDIF